jgi:trimethylamine:corrinoid methyltransferase-like protein
MDEEVCGRVQQVLKGVGDLPAEVVVELIDQVGPGGHFLDQPDTLLNFKSQFFQPPVSNRSPTGRTEWSEQELPAYGRRDMPKMFTGVRASLVTGGGSCKTGKSCQSTPKEELR